MAASQTQFRYFTYTDDNAVVWNKRGEVDAARNAIDGSSALTVNAPVWLDKGRRKHTRKAIFQDPTTFRTKTIIVYTPAAYAALTAASTLAEAVGGETGTVTYNLIEKVPERQSTARASRNLALHA